MFENIEISSFEFIFSDFGFTFWGLWFRAYDVGFRT